MYRHMIHFHICTVQQSMIWNMLDANLKTKSDFTLKVWRKDLN